MARQIGVVKGQNNDGPVLSAGEGLVIIHLYSTVIKAHINLLLHRIQAIAGGGIATFIVQVDQSQHS